MTTLTSELNLIRGQTTDDTSDYLTIDLANSLGILDGLFNNATGHTHSGAHQGGLLGANSMVDNTIPGAKLLDGSVTYAKLAAGIVESLFTGTVVTTGVNLAVAAPVMYVFCTAAVTVTLPVIGTNRPITIVALSGQVTVAATSGGVLGGSINTSTGAVMNGICSSGDSLTYKSDGTNWRVV